MTPALRMFLLLPLLLTWIVPPAAQAQPRAVGR